MKPLAPVFAAVIWAAAICPVDGLAGGFAKAKAPARKTDSAAQGDEGGDITTSARAAAAVDATAKRAVSNLFSVCAHIQDPRLYKPTWADACHQIADDGGGQTRIVASRDVKRGNPLTLFPMHSLGLRTIRSDGKKANRESDTEFVAYDVDRDGEYFGRDGDEKAGLRLKLNIPLDREQPVAALMGDRKRHVLFSTFLPEKVAQPGWLGGRMRSGNESTGNSITIPLPGAAPLCAVVATRDVKEGEEIIQCVSRPDLEELKSILAKDHARDISMLGMHVEMACQATLEQVEAAEPESEEIDTTSELGPFHAINMSYPGLKRIHQDPDIYSVDDFLTADECDRFVAKAGPHLKPCLVNNEKNGKVEQDPARTSTNANAPQVEVPTVMRKITELTNCSPDEVEILQVLKYEKGQEFVPHTDGFSGPYSSCGFVDSTRLCTVFCYLNDVKEGGSTYFPEIDLDIRPKKGMAVLHFPADVEMREDKRTLHQGSPAVDDKWLLTTWVWKDPRTEEEYGEERLPKLSGDII